MTVWKAEVGDRLGPDGVHVQVDQGSVVEIEGEKYVKTWWNGFMPLSTEWHETEAKARQSAAAKLAKYVHLLSQQYATMRQEPANASA